MLLVACAGAIPSVNERHVSAARVRWPDSTRESLEAGRSLYVRRCSSCHNLYIPSEYPSSRWPEILDEMSVQARLDPGEAAQVLRYLVVASEAK